MQDVLYIKHRPFMKSLTTTEAPVLLMKNKLFDHPQIGNGIADLIAAVTPGLMRRGTSSRSNIDSLIMTNKHNKKWNKLPKKFHFLKQITPENAVFLEYLDDDSINVLLEILKGIINQRIKLKQKDLEKVKPIINKHKVFLKKLCKVKHPISLFKNYCRSPHQTGKGIFTLIATLAPAIISLIQGLISR